jgi:hypothetical protein
MFSISVVNGGQCPQITCNVQLVRLPSLCYASSLSLSLSLPLCVCVCVCVCVGTCMCLYVSLSLIVPSLCSPLFLPVGRHGFGQCLSVDFRKSSGFSLVRVTGLDLRATALKAGLTGLELLLARSQLWEETAARHVSISVHLARLGQLAARWRRAELASWRTLLTSTSDRHARGAQPVASAISKINETE